MVALFDAAAADYDAWYETELGSTVDELQKDLIYKLLKPQKGQKILEIGCGTGNYTLELARRGLQVTGVDISLAMLAKAEEKLRAEGLQAQLLAGDIQEMELPAQSFHAVLIVAALEFVSDPPAILAQAYASLKKGGRLVVGAIAHSPWSELYKQVALENPQSVYGQATFYSKEEVLGFLPVKPQSTLTGLYFPPDFKNFERNRALALEKNPPSLSQAGFISVLWRKNND